MDDYFSYTGKWIVSYKCTFDEQGHRIWKCHKTTNDLNDWSTITPENRTIGLLNMANGLKANSSFIKFVGELKNYNDQKTYANIEDLFKWLPDDNQDKDFEDEAIAILLNHIIRSKSTKPLTTMISIVGEHRSVEIRGLSMDQPSWFYTGGLRGKTTAPIWQNLLAHYVLGFPQLFFNEDNSVKPLQDISRFLKAHRQKTDISILKYQLNKENCILQLRMDATLCHYERGELCNCIPIPGERIEQKSNDPKEPFGVSSPEIVVTSPCIEKSLSELSDVWQDRANAVLLSGPPGAGKENFALSIPFGSGRQCKLDEPNKPIIKISLANGTTDDQERQLFGFQRDDGSIADGLLTKAEYSALFIDESHYPDNKPGVRASLLRALEAKEYYPVGSQESRKIKDVQWIFASSLPLDGRDKTLTDVPPPDFWTRMTHVIQIDHPLDRRSYLQQGVRRKLILKKQKETIKDLFKFFWWDRVKNHFSIDPTKVLACDSAKVDLYNKDSSEQLLRGYVKVMLEQKPLDKIAEVFADVLIEKNRSKTLSEISIRGLRSMVSRIFSKCVSVVTAGIKNGYGQVFLNKEEMVPENIREEITKAVQDIQRIARLKHNKK